MQERRTRKVVTATYKEMNKDLIDKVNSIDHFAKYEGLLNPYRDLNLEEIVDALNGDPIFINFVIGEEWYLAYENYGVSIQILAAVRSKSLYKDESIISQQEMETSFISILKESVITTKEGIKRIPIELFMRKHTSYIIYLWLATKGVFDLQRDPKVLYEELLELLKEFKNNKRKGIKLPENYRYQKLLLSLDYINQK